MSNVHVVLIYAEGRKCLWEREDQLGHAMRVPLPVPLLELYLAVALPPESMVQPYVDVYRKPKVRVGRCPVCDLNVDYIPFEQKL